MFTEWYARWMYAWETRLTTRDENRVVRPLEWGFEWIVPFLEAHGFASVVPGPEVEHDDAAAEAAMARINQLLIRHSKEFFGYERPTDFRLEERYPQLFPTNVRPETLAQDAELQAAGRRRQAGARAVSALHLAGAHAVSGKRPGQCALVSRARAQGSGAAQAGHRGAAAVERRRLQPQLAVHHLQPHGNLGAAAFQALSRHSPAHRNWSARTTPSAPTSAARISACRQAVVDIRCCIDWLEEQGYEHFGVLGTSLGSCYAFLASAHDARFRVNAFNHASTAFGDVVWAGQ